MPPTLCVTLLGGFRIALDDEPITAVDAPRLQALLAYLVLHRDAPQPRRRIAFLFWPDTPESQARTNLRRELHHLRRALPHADRYLSVDHRTLHWRSDAPCRIDIADFEAEIAAAAAAGEAGDIAVERRGLELAVGRYRGDLLPNCYDEWVDGERERMRRAYEHALDRLVTVCEREGDWTGAVRIARRLVNGDPLREASHARLIGLHAAAGDRAAAVRAYDLCRTVLDQELGVEPGPATQRARDAALSAPAASPSNERRPAEAPPAAVEVSQTADLPPLVGRERERAAIQDWMESTARPASDPPRLLVLLGEPGIGKTRLLDELAARIRDAGGRIIRGRGFEAEMVRPYGAWTDALRSVPREWIDGSAELGSLLPEIGTAPVAPSDRNRLFDAVARWLGRLAADRGPLGVLIDDIQWLDEASAALLHYVSRLRPGSPILLACAARPAEIGDNAAVAGLVRGLARERRACAIELGPIGREHVAALARFVDLSIDADRVFADSGGNPLFALELAHALIRSAAGESGSVDDLIRNRLERLDEQARELLSWAAALGRDFDPSTAALVTGRPLPELLPALEQLERHGILRPAGSGDGVAASYDFGHDIVRQAAYAGLSGPRRRLVHLQIARALHGLDDPDGALAGEVAHHASLGGDAALAATACVRAGDRCLRIFAYADAAELARRGIGHTAGLEDGARLHLHMALLRVAVGAGGNTSDPSFDLEEEIRALTAKARSVGAVEEEAIGYSLLSVLNYERENFSRVHQSSLRAAEALRAAGAPRATDPGTTARTLAQTGVCFVSIEREVSRAEAMLLEADSLAQRAGIEIIDIPVGLGITRRFHADPVEASRLLERGLCLARAAKDHFRAFQCLTSLVMLELEGGAPDCALARCRQLSAVTAKLNEGSEAPFGRALDALARFSMAEVGAEDDLARALDTLRRLDSSRKLAQLLVFAAEVDLAAGRTDAALERSEEALAAARTIKHHSCIALAGGLLVRSARARNEPVRAENALRELWRELEGVDDLSARARSALEALTANS